MIGILGAISPVKKAYTLETEAENKLLILVCDLQHLPNVGHQLRFESQCLGTYVWDLTDHDFETDTHTPTVFAEPPWPFPIAHRAKVSKVVFRALLHHRRLGEVRQCRERKALIRKMAREPPKI